MGPVGSLIATVPTCCRLLFVCTGNDVRVVSVHTGQTVRVLSAHTQPVTSVASNPSNPLQVYTAGLDGFVRLWDYDDAVVLKVRSPFTVRRISRPPRLILGVRLGLRAYTA